MQSHTSKAVFRSVTSAQALLNSSEDMFICNAVNGLMNLALLNRKVLHINVTYSPEVEGIQVKVFKANTNYFGTYKSAFSRSVYLDQSSTHFELQTLEDDLIELIGCAKDNLVGAV